MLNAHSKVCFAPETHFVRLFIAGSPLHKYVREKGWKDLAEHLISDKFLLRLGLTFEDYQEVVDSLAGKMAPGLLYHRILERYASRKGKGAWLGDKDPANVAFLPLIREHFPSAKILHIMRDPRDILVSKKKAMWSRDRNPMVHIFVNDVQLEIGRKEGPKLFGGNYMELHYEDLIREPQKVLGQVCDHLDIGFEDAMLEFALSSKELVQPDELAWKKETFGPLLTTNSGKWAGELTPWEIALSERVCSMSFREIGYPYSKTAESLPLLQRLALVPVAIGYQVLEWIYLARRAWRLRS
jgi:hypothetical protein